MKVHITLLILLCMPCIAFAGYNTRRETHYIRGSVEALFSGHVSHSVSVVDDNMVVVANDATTMSVSVSSPGATCTWNLRSVHVQYQGAGDCLPAANGTITGAAPPPPTPWYIDTLKYTFETGLKILIDRTIGKNF